MFRKCLMSGRIGDLFILHLRLFDMKLMQNSMDDRREHYTHDPDEHQTTKERVTGGEDFRSGGFHGIDGSHAAQNHGGF